MLTKSAERTLLSLPLLLSLAACSSGDDPAAGPATGDLLLTDGPADELAYLRAVVDRFELARQSGGYTGDLLEGNVPVDVLKLDGLSAWLSRTDLPEGTYTGARVTFDPIAFNGGAFEAAGLDGTPVSVNALDNVLEVTFAAPVTVGPGSYSRFTVDFDLGASLTDNGGTLDVDPVGFGLYDDGDDDLDIDDFEGVVGGSNPAAGTFVVAAYADGDLDVPLGNVLVRLTQSTFLVDDDGDAFLGQSAFFDALVAGQTRVEVEGQLVGSVVEATKVEIDDDLAQPGDQEVELRGIITALNGTQDFDLLWTEVEGGQAAFANAFAPGDPPGVLQGILIGQGTEIELESSQAVDATALAVGQEVEVEFEIFSGAPFTADEIEIEEEFPELKGTISDTTNLVASFELTPFAGQAAITSGAIDTGVDVTVLLAQATVVFDDDDGPVLEADDLTDGLRVEVRGTVQGVSSDPDLAADVVEVEAGELEGATVAALDEQSGTFDTTGGTVEEPLGGGLTAGPLTVVIEPGCEFSGAASSAAEFFALGTGVEVDLEGIADADQPGTLRVWRVEVELD